MKTMGILMLFSIIAFTAILGAAGTCPDYCLGQTRYGNGIWNADANACDYTETFCEKGCDYIRNDCSISLKCESYCEDKVAYSNGRGGGSWCVFDEKSCEDGCNAQNRECLICDDKCEGKTFYESYVENQACKYRTANCLKGCNNNGKECIYTEKPCDDVCTNDVAYSGGSFSKLKDACEYSSNETCGNGCASDGKTCKMVQSQEGLNPDEPVSQSGETQKTQEGDKENEPVPSSSEPSTNSGQETTGMQTEASSAAPCGGAVLILAGLAVFARKS